ncbi:uncharacterized protein LOC128240828 isoform X2 [Mya arenaria]|uniref:uncharacterized protein LOC128240828 isoform X2 n=1 Tax=Mya arenaria TaxID=6604 RepID=UPI0022E74B0E|nr:uncharacterized protein LOC128240828 isoform X2 [Mya arenaria]
MLQLIRKQYNNDYVMKRNGSPKKMQRTEQMCHISKPNNLSMDIAICAGNSDVHNGPAHYYEDIAPSSNIGNSDVHNGPAHYYEDIAASSNIGNSDVHNGPAHYYVDIAPSSNIGNSDVHNGPAHYYEDIAASSNKWQL